jgi:hypothetical protein
VDAVTGDRSGSGKQQFTTDILQCLFGGQARFIVQPSESRHAAGRAFKPLRIVQFAAEHLQAAADADQFAAVAQVATNEPVPALRTQPGEVGLYRL